MKGYIATDKQLDYNPEYYNAKVGMTYTCNQEPSSNYFNPTAYRFTTSLITAAMFTHIANPNPGYIFEIETSGAVKQTNCGIPMKDEYETNGFTVIRELDQDEALDILSVKELVSLVKVSGSGSLKAVYKAVCKKSGEEPKSLGREDYFKWFEELRNRIA